MFGAKWGKRDKEICEADVEQLMICSNCHVEAHIKPSDIILSNFRHWFRCSKCAEYTRVRVSKMPKEFRRLVYEREVHKT